MQRKAVFFKVVTSGGGEALHNLSMSVGRLETTSPVTQHTNRKAFIVCLLRTSQRRKSFNNSLSGWQQLSSFLFSHGHILIENTNIKLRQEGTFTTKAPVSSL